MLALRLGDRYTYHAGLCLIDIMLRGTCTGVFFPFGVLVLRTGIGALGKPATNNGIFRECDGRIRGENVSQTVSPVPLSLSQLA